MSPENQSLFLLESSQNRFWRGFPLDQHSKACLEDVILFGLVAGLDKQVHWLRNLVVQWFQTKQDACVNRVKKESMNARIC